MIEHVSFCVTPADATACAGFYELLGFERVDPPAGLAERSIWLSDGGAAIHLVFRDADGQTFERSGPAGAGHIALVIERYAAKVSALAAAGVAVDERTAHWGAPRCYVTDPAGNQVELMAGPPL